MTERVRLNLSGNFAMLLLQPTSIGRKPWFFNVFLRFNTIYMQHSLLIAAIFATAALAACDKPTVVNVPVTPVTVPVPIAVPGPAGPTGPTGASGSTGATGKPSDSTAIIVIPPASAPAN